MARFKSLMHDCTRRRSGRDVPSMHLIVTPIAPAALVALGATPARACAASLVAWEIRAATRLFTVPPNGLDAAAGAAARSVASAESTLEKALIFEVLDVP